MQYFRFFIKTVQEFSADKAGQMSAAFAYIAVFSIGPLLLVLVSLVGIIFGEKAAQGQLYSQLSSMFGPQTAKTLQTVIANTYHSGSGVIALGAGIIGILLGAIGLSSQLQNSFNTILGAVPDPKGGIKRTIYIKLKNLLIVGLAALVIITSVVVSTIVNSDNLGLGAEVINTAASLAIFIFTLYLIYRFLPDLIIPRKIALVTAAGVGMLFIIGKVVLALVIGKNATASAFGAAASLVVLLLWLYYTAQILILGSEAIKVYGENNKLNYKPKSYTIKRRSIVLNVNQDIRGRLLESFIQGYKAKTKK